MSCDPVLVIYPGDDVSQLMQVLADNLPVNLSTAQDVSVTLNNDPSEASETQTFNIGNGGVVIATPSLGTFNLIITHTQSLMLGEADLSDIPVVVTDASGKKKTYNVPKSLTVVFPC